MTGTDLAAGAEVEVGATVNVLATEKPKLTLGQENAIARALSYLDFTAFSRSGLIKQLVFEGFSREQAAHGAKAVGF